MDATSLRKEFEKQIEEADQKIEAAERSLTQLKEYRIKLAGGMETLELLASDEEQKAPEPPAPPAE